MPGTVEFIESYFAQTLSSEERAAFELKCTTDEAFAAEVAFYITARQALREELLMQKVKAWKMEDTGENELASMEAEEAAPVIAMPKRTSMMRWVSYAAAACIIVFGAMFLFETPSASQRMVANYISEHHSFSNEMDASFDSVQTGIAAYKNKNYDSALFYFKAVATREPGNSDVKKYAGLCYLKLKDYDNALKEFDALAASNLEYNPGNILKASTLILRDEPGDEEAAKKILEIVVDNQQVGYKEAGEWLDKL